MQILLQLLLPITQVIAITLPPFPHRATIFTPLIIIVAAWSYFDVSATNPLDTTKDPDTTHLALDVLLPLLSQWPWYLSTLSTLLFSNPSPEYLYWRLSRDPMEALSLLWLAKLKWASALYCSPRGVGWNFRVKGVPSYNGPRTKIGFVAHQLRWLLVCAIGMDALGFYTRTYYDENKSWGAEGVTSYSRDWGRSAVNAVHGLFMPYFGLNLAYGQIALLCVTVGISAPEVRGFAASIFLSFLSIPWFGFYTFCLLSIDPVKRSN